MWLGMLCVAAASSLASAHGSHGHTHTHRHTREEPEPGTSNAQGSGEGYDDYAPDNDVDLALMRKYVAPETDSVEKMVRIHQELGALNGTYAEVKVLCPGGPRGPLPLPGESSKKASPLFTCQASKPATRAEGPFLPPSHPNLPSPFPPRPCYQGWCLHIVARVLCVSVCTDLFWVWFSIVLDCCCGSLGV